MTSQESDVVEITRCFDAQSPGEIGGNRNFKGLSLGKTFSSIVSLRHWKTVPVE